MTFVTADGAEQYLPYAQLAECASQEAQRLRARGVDASAAVAVQLSCDVASVVRLMALWQIGACVASVPAPRRSDSRGSLQSLAGALRNAGVRQVYGRADLDRAVDAAPARVGDRATSAAALIQFTSGSTAVPKGVVLSANAVAGHVDALGRSLDLDRQADVVLSWLPLQHDMGLVGFLLTTMRWRLPLVLVDPRRFAAHPASWLELCARHRATFTGAPNFAFDLMARIKRFDIGPQGLRSIRVMLSGGERVSWRTLTAFADVGEQYGVAWSSLTPVYGLAEATLAVSVPAIGRGPQQASDGGVLLGKPLGGSEIRIQGSPGRHSGGGPVQIRAPWLLSSYLTADGWPAATDVDGWLTTSDAGRLVDGELIIDGRRDEVVISGGRNVYAEDVELAAQQEDLVLAAAAYRCHDDPTRFDVVIEALDPSAAGRLARAARAAVARDVSVRLGRVVVLTPRGIPRTTSGKPRRAECRRRTAERAWPAVSLLEVA